MYQKLRCQTRIYPGWGTLFSVLFRLPIRHYHDDGQHWKSSSLYSYRNLYIIHCCVNRYIYADIITSTYLVFSCWRRIGQRYRRRFEHRSGLRRRLPLKGSVEVCAAYIFPLILYRLPVFPFPEGARVPTLLPVVSGRQANDVQCLHHGGLGMRHLASHQHLRWQRILWRQEVLGLPSLALHIPSSGLSEGFPQSGLTCYSSVQWLFMVQKDILSDVNRECCVGTALWAACLVGWWTALLV